MSIQRLLMGYAIGASIGVALGILIGWHRLFRNLLDPTIQALRPVPMAAWLPFATLIFGIKQSAAIFLIALGTFYPVVLATASGARQTPELLVRAALMLGTSRRRVLTRVVIPSALPSIVTGLRLGLGVAWVMVVVAEMLAVRGGLGYAVWGSFTYNRMDLIITTIITFGLYGWISDRLIVALSYPLTRWQAGIVRR